MLEVESVLRGESLDIQRKAITALGKQKRLEPKDVHILGLTSFCLTNMPKAELEDELPNLQEKVIAKVIEQEKRELTGRERSFIALTACYYVEGFPNGK